MAGYDELSESARGVRPGATHEEFMAAVEVALKIRKAVINGDISELEEVRLRGKLNTTLGERCFIPATFCRRFSF